MVKDGEVGGLKKVLKFWPFLFIPFGFAYVYITKHFGWDSLCSRASTEMVALPLVGISLLGFLVLAIKTRNEFIIGMTFLTVAFFCREWHFAGTSKGIYVALLIFIGWFLCRRKIIDEMINGQRIKVWLTVTASCYLLSQIIARRVFAERYLGLLPLEGQYHIFFEEVFEVTAHVLMIITCAFAWSLFYFKKKKIEALETQTA